MKIEAYKKPIIRIIIFLLFLFTLFSFFSLKTWADAPLTQEEYEKAIIPENPNFTKEDSDQLTFDNFLHNLNIGLMGPQTPEGRLSLGKPGGAIGQIGQLIAYMVGNPPVATSQYLADLGRRVGLPVKTAYAQGVGWEALHPVLKVWKAFRNISYSFFVVFFIVLGFMIMFRAKINPQTIISVEAALPRIIATLLLITFSYAIAGLLIDLIYILIYLVVGVFYLFGILTSNSVPLDLLFSKNPFSLVYIKSGSDIFLNAPANAIQEIIGGLFGNWLNDTLLSRALGSLAKTVFGIAIFFSLFRLFFGLLMAYLGIVINVILAPLNLLFNVLPGSQSFQNWLKSMLANVLAFPAVALMFLLAAILIGPVHGAACNTADNRWCVAQDIGFYPQVEKSEAVWIPPFLNFDEKSGGGSSNAFQGLLAFGIIIFMPQVLGMLKKILKVEDIGIGGAIFGGIMSGAEGGMSLGRTALGVYQFFSARELAKLQKRFYGKKLEEEKAAAQRAVQGS